MTKQINDAFFSTECAQAISIQNDVKSGCVYPAEFTNPSPTSAEKDSFNACNPKSFGLTSFAITQKLLIEQTLPRLYSDLNAKWLLKLMIKTGQLLPNYVAKVLGSIHRGTIVEIGCGWGFLSNTISLMNRADKVIGIDPNPDNIAIAKSSIHQRDNIQFFTSDFSKLPSMEADLILIDLNSVNLQNTQALRRVFEWLTPAGDVLIKTRTKWHPKTWLSRLINLYEHPGAMYIEPLPAELLLSSCGFQILHNTNQTPSLLPPLYQYVHAEKPVYGVMPNPTQSSPSEVAIEVDKLAELKTATTQQQDVIESISTLQIKATPAQSGQSTGNHEEVLSFIFSKDWAPLSQDI